MGNKVEQTRLCVDVCFVDYTQSGSGQRMAGHSPPGECGMYLLMLASYVGFDDSLRPYYMINMISKTRDAFLGICSDQMPWTVEPGVPRALSTPCNRSSWIHSGCKMSEGVCMYAKSIRSHLDFCEARVYIAMTSRSLIHSSGNLEPEDGLATSRRHLFNKGESPLHWLGISSRSVKLPTGSAPRGH
jgi:hypothetical protein